MDSQSSQSIDESKDDNFLAYSNQPTNKPIKQRLTILDDIDQLHEDINGPGALENELKTKQIIQQTFDRMHEEKVQRRECVKQGNNLKKSQILMQNAKQAKVHGLISYMMKIDLSQPPSEQNLYLFKGENVGLGRTGRGSLRKSEGYDLFGRALQTARNQGRKINNYRI